MKKNVCRKVLGSYQVKKDSRGQEPKRGKGRKELTFSTTLSFKAFAQFREIVRCLEAEINYQSWAVGEKLESIDY